MTKAKTQMSAQRPTRSHRMRAAAILTPSFDGQGHLPPQAILRAARMSGAEDGTPRVLGVRAQGLLDPQQLVVLRHAVRARGRAGLDLAAAGGDGEVRDRRVLRLARA